MFEEVACYYCGSTSSTFVLNAEEDLTGKPGTFRFVQCDHCGLMYQNPRVNIETIPSFYDDEYIAHRKKTDWGVLTPFYKWAMGKHDRDKDAIVSKYVELNESTKVLDVGCAVGTFLTYMREKYSVQPAGVDFKDCSYFEGFEHIDFHHGLFYEQDLADDTYDLVTMWHFLEHDYEPIRTLETAKRVVSPGGRIVIEVPRLDSASYSMYKERWPGLQAPQHTVCFDKESLHRFVEKAGLEVVDYLPYGAFPAYFYLFTGAAFKVLKGKGIDLDRWVMPYFLGQVATAPVMLFEKHLNLAMQTIVCRKPSEC